VDSDIGIELLLAQLLWKKGEQGEAKQLLDSVEEKIHQRGFFLLLPALLRTRIDVLLSENKTTEALLLAEENELAEGQARVLWKVGRTTEALDIIQIESQRLQQTELRDDWLRCKVLEALLLNANAHRQEAMSCLEDVLRETEASGHLRLYLDEGPAMHRLLQALVQEGQSTDTTARLLTFFRKEDLESSEESLSGVQRTLRGSAGGQQPLLEALSARELEVLQLIAEGLSNREIAKRLFVALDTVKGHNRRIYGKLQVKRRTEAVAAARDLGLL
jgi:LuxR family maltose regulon positive regulatory protein